MLKNGTTCICFVRILIGIVSRISVRCRRVFVRVHSVLAAEALTIHSMSTETVPDQRKNKKMEKNTREWRPHRFIGFFCLEIRFDWQALKSHRISLEYIFRTLLWPENSHRNEDFHHYRMR